MFTLDNLELGMMIRCRNGHTYVVEERGRSIDNGFTAYEINGRDMWIAINPSLYNFNTLDDITGHNIFDIMMVKDKTGEIIYDREAGDTYNDGSGVLYVNLNNRNVW